MTLDELAFYGRELAAAEIASIHLRQGGNPKLAIQPQSGGVALSWLVEVLNPEVEFSTNLVAGNWQTATNAVLSTQTNSTMLLPISDNSRFFRLKSGN